MALALGADQFRNKSDPAGARSGRTWPPFHQQQHDGGMMRLGRAWRWLDGYPRRSARGFTRSMPEVARATRLMRSASRCSARLENRGLQPRRPDVERRDPRPRQAFFTATGHNEALLRELEYQTNFGSPSDALRCEITVAHHRWPLEFSALPMATGLRRLSFSAIIRLRCALSLSASFSTRQRRPGVIRASTKSSGRSGPH